jgi:uncharacterized protein (TIGR03663 family)
VRRTAEEGDFALSSRALSSTQAALARGGEQSRRLRAETEHPTSTGATSRPLLSARVVTYLVAALAFIFILVGGTSWWSVGEMYSDRFGGHSARGPHEDYVAFYAAGRLVRAGQGNLLYDVPILAHKEVESIGRGVGGTGVLAYFNPPFVAAAFAPLSALPIETAAVVIGIVGTALAAAATFALQRLLGLEDRLRRLLLWLGFFSLGSVPWVVLHGQLSMLLLLGWLSFIVLQMKGREKLSGVALALLLVKPQMAILPLALLLWKRRWWALATFATAAWVLAMVSLAVSGPGALVDYPRFLLESTGWDNRWGITPASMFGWNGFLARLLEYNSPVHLALTWTLSGITALAALMAFRGPWAPAKPRFLLQCGALLTASLLVNPHLYMQDLSLMALAVALGLAYGLRTNRKVFLWIGLGVGVWLAQLWGLSALDNAGVNILTPAMAVLLVTLLVAQRQGEPVESGAPVPLEAATVAAAAPARQEGIGVFYLIQGAYVAFIVAFCIARGTFLMPDVIFLLLVAGFVWGRQRMRFIRDFAPFVLLLASYDAMRGFADNLTSTVHIDYPITLERTLFLGHVPTQDLQRWLWDMGSTHWYDSLAALLHAAHFVVPLLFAALIWQYRRDQYWRFVITLLLVSYAAFITYMLVPTAPPWLAGLHGHLAGVNLINLSPHTAFLYDKLNPNPVAAMPSLHAAYPWLFFLFTRRLWGRWGWPVIVYPFAVFFASVYLGHHYVVDIIGGVIYASAGYYLVCGPVGEYFARNRRLPTWGRVPAAPMIGRLGRLAAGAVIFSSRSNADSAGATDSYGRGSMMKEHTQRDRPPRSEGGGRRPSWRLLREHWYFALFLGVMALAAVLRFWELGARTFHGDEAIHAGFAWQLADGRGYVHNPLTHGPFQFFGTALIFILFGDSDYTARVLPALFGAALVALPFFFRGHLGRAGALAAGLLLALSPTLLYFSRFAREDIYIAFFTLSLVICAWRYLAEGGRRYLYLIAGLLALSFATKEVAYIIAAMFLVYLDLLVAREFAVQMGLSSPSGWLPESPSPAKEEARESYYAVLGLRENASPKAVRRAFRKLKRTRTGRTDEGRRRIEEAYEALTDVRSAARVLICDAAADSAEGEAREPAAGWRRQTLTYAALLPTAWLLVAFWPLLGSLRRRLGLRAFPRAGDILVLIGCLSLPLYAATVEKLPFVGDRGYNVSDELLVMHATVLGLMAAAFAVGFLWRWRVWMACSAIFYVIFILLFTSFFTNPDGFWTGTWGSLDYWLGQQGVQLGNQPSYYYFMLLPVYEFLPLVFALGAAAVYVLRGRLRHKLIALDALAAVVVLAFAGEKMPLIGPYRTEIGFLAVIGAMLLLPMAALTRLLFFWTLSALFAFTLAGEKMPWLSVHIALPLSILAGQTLGDLVRGLELHVELPPLRRWAPAAAASATAALAVAVLFAFGSAGPAAVAGALLALAALATVGWSAYARGPQAAMRVGATAAGMALLVMTARAGILASWGHPNLLQNSQMLASRDRGDTPVELLAYVQPSPDIPVIRDAIDKVAAASGLGVHLPIVVDARDDFSWPWAWYLRKYENITFLETDEQYQPPPGSVVLVGWRDRARVDIDPALFTEGIRYHHRWWFPEDYSGLDSAQVMRDLLNPKSWESWGRYFIDREPPSGLPTLDAVAYFPSDSRYSEVLSAAIHKERQP